MKIIYWGDEGKEKFRFVVQGRVKDFVEALDVLEKTPDKSKVRTKFIMQSILEDQHFDDALRDLIRENKEWKERHNLAAEEAARYKGELDELTAIYERDDIV